MNGFMVQFLFGNHFLSSRRIFREPDLVFREVVVVLVVALGGR